MKSDLARSTGSKKKISPVRQKCRCQRRTRITRLAGTEVNEKNEPEFSRKAIDCEFESRWEDETNKRVTR